MLKKDELVDLMRYGEKGTGYCTHTNMLAAAYIELLIRDKFLSGKVSLDRCSYTGSGNKVRKHVWARFTPLDERMPIILDVVKGGGFAKPLSATIDYNWPYQRPVPVQPK